MNTRLISFVLLAAVAWGQPKGPSAAKPKPVAPNIPAIYPLETLRVVGNKNVPAAKIIAASGLKIGRTVVKEDFEGARTRLLESGAFTSVGYEYKPGAAATGYDAVLEVRELSEFYPYQFEDLPEAKANAAIGRENTIFADKIPVVPAIMQRYAQAIEKELGGKVHVVGKLAHPEGSKELAVIFSPEESRPNIAQVGFTGNRVIPDDLLIMKFSEAAIGVPYSEAEARRRLDASIRPLYEARGRLRVSFPKVVATKAERVNGVAVMVTVDEGEPYNLGQLTIAGVSSGEATQLAKVADLKKGDLANFDDVNAGVAKIHQRYRNNGYLHVTEKVDRQVRDATHTVDVTLTIEPGPQYHYGKLTIQGLDILNEPYVRKMWGDRTGKPFSPDAPDAFLNRMKEEQLFDNLGKTRSDTDINDASKIVDVTLVFTGGKPEPPPR